MEKHNSSVIVTCMSDRASKNNLLKEITFHLNNQAVTISYNAEMLTSFLAAFTDLCNCISIDPHLGQYIYFFAALMHSSFPCGEIVLFEICLPHP
jgi:hypothetical protein